VKLDNIELKKPARVEDEIELLRKIPTDEIRRITKTLVIKHKKDYFVLKNRGTKAELKDYDFEVITIGRIMDNIDKYGDIMKKNISEEMRNNLCGKHLIVDITGCKLEEIKTI